jgi:redox-sensing transcriptional repressor
MKFFVNIKMRCGGAGAWQFSWQMFMNEVIYMETKEISKAVIARLPRYYRYLGELLESGVERVSSNELSARMHVTASQIRQDLNNFGGFGQQGYGYNVKYLYSEMAKILGIDHQHNLIIIGAGNLGQAIANYANFEKRGFLIKGMFDINPRLIGLVVRGIEIRGVDDLEEFIKENDVQMAALTIPKTKAPEIADRLVNAGIKGIWNFAHVDLNVPDDVVVENVHLSESLMRLSYRVCSMQEGRGDRGEDIQEV